MKSWRIGVNAKLLGIAALGALLAIVVGVLSISNLGSVNARGKSMYKDRTLPIEHLGVVSTALADVQRGLLRIQLERKHEVTRTEIAAYKRNATETKNQVALYAASSLLPEEKAKLGKLRTDLVAYGRLWRSALAALQRGDAAHGAELTAKADAVNRRARGTVAAMVKLNDAEAAVGSREIQATYASSRTITLVVLALAVAAGLGIGWWIARGIKRSVSDVLKTLRSLQEHCLTGLHEAMDAMAQGDLTKTVVPVTPPIESIAGDEVGDAAREANAIRERTIATIEAYNAMRDQLRSMVAKIEQAATHLSSASEEMAATSEETGRAVSEITGAVADVASGAERQVQMVERAKESTDATAQVAGETKSAADAGVEAAQRAAQAMASVEESSSAVNQAMQGLAEKSDQIGGIVETITGIAGQTNLLALNAAIEAARAGEQGRGFAVVAEEVRKLAEESQTAAASISTLVEEMQAETGRTAEVVEDGARRSADGAAVVEQAREAFLQIGGAVEDVTGRISEIAQAMTEVAAVAAQSSASTEQVSASSEETSASTQEIAASAQELARTAEGLAQLVGEFKVA
jgi:methyl-accepting chemotaxis protein